MKMFSLAAVLSLVAAAGVVTACAEEQEEGQQQPTSFWMQKKLEYSQRVLNALPLEDFEEIRKNAAAMKRLSRIEGFVRRTDTEQYRTQLHVFEFANNELIRSADNKNIEGAALAFTQLTLSCVNCHKIIRQPAVTDEDKQP